MGIGKARAWDADICQSRDGSKTPIRSYYAEGEYVPGTPASQYYGIDQVGSVRRVFAGTTSASAYGYDPYGLPLQATAPKTDYVYAGDATAAYALGTWYLHGAHVKKDIAKGTELLRQAATENVLSALYDLAVSHENGIGTKKNARKAYELYLGAAIWGHQQSYYEVGRCLFYGIGVRRSRAFAAVWLDRAKDLGVS